MYIKTRNSTLSPRILLVKKEKDNLYSSFLEAFGIQMKEDERQEQREKNMRPKKTGQVLKR